MKNDQDEPEKALPSEFQQGLNKIRDRVVPEESLKRFLITANEVENKVAEMNRSANLARLGAMLGCLLVAICAAALVVLSKPSFLFATVVVAYVFSTFGFIVVFFRSVRDIKLAGPIVLDCGRMKSNGLGFLLLSTIPLTVVVLCCVDFENLKWYHWAAVAALIAPAAIYFSSIARGRLQLRTNGIWHYIGFLPWHEIESWGWDENFESALLIERSNGPKFFRRAVLKIPLEYRSLFEDHLHQYCVTVRERD